MEEIYNEDYFSGRNSFFYKFGGYSDFTDVWQSRLDILLKYKKSGKLLDVGCALGYMLGGWATGQGHWRWGFYAVVPPGILLGLLCLSMRNPARGSADGLVAAPPRARLRDYLALFRIRSYVLNCLGMAAMTFAIGGISHWMPTYVCQFRHGGGDAEVGTIFGAITAFTGVTATLLGGIAGDALRHRIRGAYFLVSAGGLILCFPFFIAMFFVPFPWAWIFVFLAEFCLFFNTGPSNTALANVAHPSVRSTAFALNIFFIHALGDGISPPVIGALTDAFDKNMNVGFGAVGVMMLVGAGFWLWGARYLDEDTAAAAAPHGE